MLTGVTAGGGELACEMDILCFSRPLVLVLQYKVSVCRRCVDWSARRCPVTVGPGYTLRWPETGALSGPCHFSVLTQHVEELSSFRGAFRCLRWLWVLLEPTPSAAP